MNLRTVIMILTGAIAAAGLTASLALRNDAQAKLRVKEQLLRQQNAQVSDLTTEHQRLSNLVLRTNSPSKDRTPQDYTAELSKLRAEAEALRQQTNELAKQVAENRRTRPLPNMPMPDRGGSGHSDMVVSSSDSKEYKEQLYRVGAASPHSGPFNIDARKDAQNLGHAVHKYAAEHAGEVPTSFDQTAPQHFIESYRVPNASEYDIVYRGSLNDLTNIPRQAVALVREREPWPTPAGKLGRIYVMANGFVKIVESDDNFQSWEAEYIVPPSDRR
jgi:hypothetical protein